MTRAALGENLPVVDIDRRDYPSTKHVPEVVGDFRQRAKIGDEVRRLRELLERDINKARLSGLEMAIVLMLSPGDMPLTLEGQTHPDTKRSGRTALAKKT